MEYKHKLIKLLKGCISDPRIFERRTRKNSTIDRNGNKHEAVYYEDIIELRDGAEWNGYNHGLHDKFQEYYIIDCKNSQIAERVGKKYKNIHEYYEIQKKKYTISITFEEQPPLSMYFYPKKDESKSLIKSFSTRRYFGLFGEKYVVNVSKITVHYTPQYRITHGSLETIITEEEAKELYETAIYHRKKFTEEKEIKKLDERLKIYGKKDDLPW